MDIDATFICAFCFQENETTVDPSGGMIQCYVEDCQVCCRPNMLTVRLETDGSEADITSAPA
jgi:hypothetical protein